MFAEPHHEGSTWLAIVIIVGGMAMRDDWRPSPRVVVACDAPRGALVVTGDHSDSVTFTQEERALVVAERQKADRRSIGRILAVRGGRWRYDWLAIAVPRGKPLPPSRYRLTGDVVRAALLQACAEQDAEPNTVVFTKATASRVAELLAAHDAGIVAITPGPGAVADEDSVYE